ncbi:MAG: hypothetical protein ACOC3V_03375 [bacterium]
MVRLFRNATNAEKLLPDGSVFYDINTFPSEIVGGSIDDHYELKYTKIGNQIWLAENLKMVGYFDSGTAFWSNFDQPTANNQLNDNDPQYIPLSSDPGDTFLNLSLDIGHLYGLGAIEKIKETISSIGLNDWLLPSRSDYNDLFDYIKDNYNLMSDRDINSNYTNLLKSVRQENSPLGNDDYVRPMINIIVAGDYKI